MAEQADHLAEIVAKLDRVLEEEERRPAITRIAALTPDQARTVRAVLLDEGKAHKRAEVTMAALRDIQDLIAGDKRLYDEVRAARKRQEDPRDA